MRPQKVCGRNVLGGTVLGGEEDSLPDPSKFMSCANQKKRKDVPCAIFSGNEKKIWKKKSKRSDKCPTSH